MIDPESLEQIAARIAQAIPPEVSELRGELRGNLRMAISAALASLDLVTREELDVQSALLVRTRERLEALERRVEELERDRLARGG